MPIGQGRVVDAWINVDMDEWGDPDWMVRVAVEYFHGDITHLRTRSLSEVLDSMDRAGVDHAIIDVDVHAPSKHSLSFVEAAPERFSVAARVDPTSVMSGVRLLRSALESWPVVMARAIPFVHDLPPNDRAYYPLYAACVDAGLPISVNAGIPGPPVPGECQHPMFLDRVCFDFPDLTVIMAHGADPWWDVAIRLMLKYPRLHLMTSAWRPKYLPDSLLHFMRTRGRDRVLWASDYPMLQIDTCLDDARRLDLPDDVLDAYLGGNVRRLLERSR